MPWVNIQSHTRLKRLTEKGEFDQKITNHTLYFSLEVPTQLVQHCFSIPEKVERLKSYLIDLGRTLFTDFGIWNCKKRVSQLVSHQVSTSYSRATQFRVGEVIFSLRFFFEWRVGASQVLPSKYYDTWCIMMNK